MPLLEWDNVGERVYETGLDRGVLYLPDGSAVPWNGLTSVIEKFDKDSSPVYFDGMKINDLVVLGDFAASMKAVTYPDEFVELEGLGSVRPGLFYADQMPKPFGLCYRTQIGNDLEGDTVGYKIHILYNVIAVPNDKTYATMSNDPNLVEFEWNITAVPEEVPGFRPTAHIILDTREIDPWLLEDIEEKLYGSDGAFASLIPMPELVTFINDWYRVRIVDHGDGTWSAITARDGFIFYYDPEEEHFRIENVNAIYLDDDTFIIYDTTDQSQVPQIAIYDHGNGIWSAYTDQEGLISMVDEDTYQILNANVEFVNSYEFRLSDTEAEG